jgi:hypothetical protein
VRTNETGAEVVDVVCPKGHKGGAGEVTTGYLGLATCGHPLGKDKACDEKLVAVEEVDESGEVIFRNGKAVARKSGGEDKPVTGADKLAKASGGDKPAGKRAKPKSKPKAKGTKTS